ncbi:MAG: hypothetical protein IPH53_11085 [Flavobacteriales bacterium]|nr:hypothetical protein [Flavobacteriales bacterium]
MRHSALVVLCALAITGSAQTTFRVMVYNLLAFPDPIPVNRQDTLAKIIAYHPVDLLITEEMLTEAGADLVLTEARNVNGTTRFSRAAFVVQISDPNSPYKLMQTLFYDHEQFTLKQQRTLTTSVRDINVFTLYMNDVDLAQTMDTTFMTIYAVHFKASQGAVNEYDRQQMAEVLIDDLITLPPGSNVVVAGDMNIYSAAEGAYTVLTATGAPLTLRDPLTLPVQWNANGAMAEHHTQSTRSSPLYGEGAGGGLDDRFDIGLFSDALMDGTNGSQLVPGSYRPLGNSGTCLNYNITDCSPLQTPYSVLRALYYMSDHLPLVFDLSYARTVTGVPSQPHTVSAMTLTGREDGTVCLGTDAPGTGMLRYSDLSGRIILEQQVRFGAGSTSFISPAGLPAGSYVVQLVTAQHTISLRTLLEP